jgi:hypothetical protein
VTLSCTGSDAWSAEDVAEAFQALSSLAAKQEVDLRLHLDEHSLGAAQVQQLGRALGSRLKQLTVVSCTLQSSFWPAVWRYLPGLERLEIQNYVGYLEQADMACFCSHATHPLQLVLTLYVFTYREEQLEQLCRTWGVPQVTVTIKRP